MMSAAWPHGVAAIHPTVQAAPVGSRVSIRGEAPPDALNPGPVEIRWNGQGGPSIGATTVSDVRSFTMEVTIPESAPGVYLMVLVSGGDSVARVSFEVTPRPEKRQAVDFDQRGAITILWAAAAIVLQLGMALLAHGAWRRNRASASPLSVE